VVERLPVNRTPASQGTATVAQEGRKIA
jgi:hypothetical protein